MVLQMDLPKVLHKSPRLLLTRLNNFVIFRAILLVTGLMGRGQTASLSEGTGVRPFVSVELTVLTVSLARWASSREEAR